MQLIGMLDSPFVRRVAISMQLLGLAYDHRSISVLRTYAEFREINPLVKAPTLVCDDGELLVDSTLIIDYLETLAGRSLMPADPAERRRALKLIGQALVAAEKAVQIMLEHRLHPLDKQNEPWAARLNEQLIAALSALDLEIAENGLEAGERIDQAGLTAAVAWGFTQIILAETILAADYPALSAHAARAEQLPAFIAAPPI